MNVQLVKQSVMVLLRDASTKSVVTDARVMRAIDYQWTVSLALVNSFIIYST